MISEQNVLQTLKSRFGFDAFKPGQSEIISALLADESVMAMLPTGGGKSLIYQMVGYLRPGVTIIVTPLLSLMQDQVARLNYQGERAVVAFNSTLTGYERQRVLARLGQYRFVFISPEMLSQEDVISAFQQVDINLMVIDEAHTMLTWGPDFRPDYLALPQIHERLNTPQLLLLTATATPEMLAKLKDDFAKETRKWFTYVESVNRPNIYLHTEHFTQRQDKKERLASLITTLKGPGLVYFSSRKQATAMARELQRETGKRIAAYHGGLESTERFRIQQQFMLGQLDVIMATSAFGMGIDKDNIRHVIHYHMSSDIPNYLQEFGRAGRNGETAVAILLFAPGDEQLHYGLIDQTIPEKQAIQAVAVPLGGGAPVFSFDAPLGSTQTMPRWAPDDRGVDFALIRGGAGNIWRQPVPSGAMKQITNFPSGIIRSFSWSPDGKTLFLARGSQSSDIILLKSAKN
jgi:ATP-dependent DNA helicase RecQ